MCKTRLNYAINQFPILWPFQYSKHFCNSCLLDLACLKLGKVIIQNALKLFIGNVQKTSPN